eukprot:scaffold717_cov60-Phaeocystis_antarctica.AAC.5
MVSIGCQEAEMLGAWRVRRPRGQRGPDMRSHGDTKGLASLHLKKSPRPPCNGTKGCNPVHNPVTQQGGDSGPLVLFSALSDLMHTSGPPAV